MQRTGATLLEVLVAIFVMGIGLIALFTLFPIGILRMAEAIQADRAAVVAHVAEGLAGIQWTGSDPQGNPLTFDLRRDPQVLFDGDPLNNPDVFADPQSGVAGMNTADPDGPSYPVFVDPIGYLGATGLPSQHWVGGQAGTIRRRRVSFAGTDLPSLLRWFTLLDDMPFDEKGTVLPDDPTQTVPANKTFAYDGQYSWAYLLKRPRTADRSVVNLWVVVYKGRPFGLNADLELAEELYQDLGDGVNTVDFDALRSVITVAVDNSVRSLPKVRSGTWLLDATYVPSLDTRFGTVKGDFYQVLGVNELIADVKVEYEVSPALPDVSYTAAGIQRRIVILDGVIDVFAKGPGRLP